MCFELQRINVISLQNSMLILYVYILHIYIHVKDIRRESSLVKSFFFQNINLYPAIVITGRKL